MKLNYSGSGIVFYNQNEYQCDLYINEKQGRILIKIRINNPLANFLELPIRIKFLSGELNTGYKFTLVNCSRNKMENLISEGTSVYSYYSRYMFKGVGGKGCDNIKLYKVVFELSDIIEWGDISGYTVGKKYEILKNNDLARTLYENEKIIVKYVVKRDISPVHYTELLKEEIILKQSGSIEISFREENSIEEFNIFFKKVKRLIEVSALTKLYLNKLTGWSADYYTMYGNEKVDRAIDIISYDLKKDEEIRENRQEAWKWITLHELIANDSFVNYISKYDRLEPVIDLYLEILESKDMPIIRIFLNVIQALETYHSRFVTNSIEEYKKRIELIILKNRPEKFIQGETKFLMAKSKRFITLESRLADLLLAKFVVHFDTGDINYLDFPNVIAKTRNYYIHYDEEIKASGRVLSEEEISIYNSTLLYMLEYYLLLEIGFSDIKQIEEKLNERWGNASQTLSLIKRSSEVEKSSKDIVNSSNLNEIN